MRAGRLLRPCLEHVWQLQGERILEKGKLTITKTKQLTTVIYQSTASLKLLFTSDDRGYCCPLL